jgi:hypothetical protein
MRGLVDKRAVILFILLILLALLLVVIYRIEKDPFKKIKSSQVSGYQSEHSNTFDFDRKIMAYKTHGASCHRNTGIGLAGNPYLDGITIPTEGIRHIFQNGRGAMPAFRDIREPDLTGLTEYLASFNPVYIV